MTNDHYTLHWYTVQIRPKGWRGTESKKWMECPKNPPNCIDLLNLLFYNYDIIIIIVSENIMMI